MPSLAGAAGAAGAAAGAGAADFGAAALLVIRAPRPRPRRDFGGVAMLFALGDEEGLSDHDARVVGNLVGVANVGELRAGLLGNSRQRVAVHDRVVDAFLREIVIEGRLD